MDWGLVSFTRSGDVYLRQRASFHWSFYLFSCLINLVLRFSWRASRLRWFRSLPSSSLVLVLEVLEVCRRALWNIIRIEWEVIVQHERLLASKDGGDSSSDKGPSKKLAKILTTSSSSLQ